MRNMRNIILSTVIGKVTVKRAPNGWELTTWVRPEHLSWKSMSKQEVEQYTLDDYEGAVHQAHYHYRDLLARTFEWSIKEYLI